MEIEYLSQSEERVLRNLVREGSELASLSAKAFAALEEDTDYDSVLVSFEGEETMRISLNDSPYLIVMCEIEQTISLFSQYDDDLEPILETTDNLDEDGVETIVDVIASRPLSDEIYEA